MLEKTHSSSMLDFPCSISIVTMNKKNVKTKDLQINNVPRKFVLIIMNYDNVSKDKE